MFTALQASHRPFLLTRPPPPREMTWYLGTSGRGWGSRGRLCGHLPRREDTSPALEPSVHQRNTVLSSVQVLVEERGAMGRTSGVTGRWCSHRCPPMSWRGTANCPKFWNEPILLLTLSSPCICFPTGQVHWEHNNHIPLRKVRKTHELKFPHMMKANNSFTWRPLFRPWGRLRFMSCSLTHSTLWVKSMKHCLQTAKCHCVLQRRHGPYSWADIYTRAQIWALPL